MQRPIKPVKVISDCCDSYKEIVFYATSFPLESHILNSTASNYTPAVITTTGLQTIIATFSALGSTTITKYNTDVKFSTADGTAYQTVFSDDNTIEIGWDSLGAIEGIFTIKIYPNPNNM